MRSRAQMRPNPVCQAESLWGDTAGVIAELVRPRESIIDRLPCCDVSDEQDGECGRACRRGRALQPWSALVQFEQDDKARRQKANPEVRCSPATSRPCISCDEQRQRKTHQVGNYHHERPQEVRPEVGFPQPPNSCKEERNRDQAGSGDCCDLFIARSSGIAKDRTHSTAGGGTLIDPHQCEQLCCGP